MIRVAIVEDDKCCEKLLVEHLNRFSLENGQKFRITSFSDGLAFLDNYKSDYDIIFMDIVMPMIDGLITSERLRRLDSKVALVYVSNMGQYAIKGYKYDAVDFLLKPVHFEVVSALLHKIINKLKLISYECTMVNTINGVVKIYFSEISYVEVSNHKSRYHTDKGIIETWGTLKETEGSLPSNEFVRCNSGYIVNVGRIERINRFELKLGTGETLPISRSKKQALLDAITRYIGR